MLGLLKILGLGFMMLNNNELVKSVKKWFNQFKNQGNLTKMNYIEITQQKVKNN